MRLILNRFWIIWKRVPHCRHCHRPIWEHLLHALGPARSHSMILYLHGASDFELSISTKPERSRFYGAAKRGLDTFLPTCDMSVCVKWHYEIQELQFPCRRCPQCVQKWDQSEVTGLDECKHFLRWSTWCFKLLRAHTWYVMMRNLKAYMLDHTILQSMPRHMHVAFFTYFLRAFEKDADIQVDLDQREAEMLAKYAVLPQPAMDWMKHLKVPHVIRTRSSWT